MSALQCGTRLYVDIHEFDLAQVEIGLLARFDAGQRVAEVARSLLLGTRLDKLMRKKLPTDPRWS